MFHDASGPLYEFLKNIGRDMSDCGHETPFAWFAKIAGVRAGCTLPTEWIVAHLNELAESDFELLETSKRKFHVVHSPRSHDYFGHSRFPFERLRALGFNICLGTDSLASNENLSLFAEMRALQRSEPALSPKEVLEMVLGQEAEIGLARSLQHPEVETIPLRDDPLLLTAHPEQLPGKLRRARLNEVAAWPLIFYERGSSDWTLTRGLFRHAALVPNVALEVDTIETAKRMVERGLGMAFLPLMAVAPEIRRGELVTIKLWDAEPLHRSLDIIHPRHRPLRAEAQSFLEVVRQVVRQRPNSASTQA